MTHPAETGYSPLTDQAAESVDPFDMGGQQEFGLPEPASPKRGWQWTARSCQLLTVVVMVLVGAGLGYGASQSNSTIWRLHPINLVLWMGGSEKSFEQMFMDAEEQNSGDWEESCCDWP